MREGAVAMAGIEFDPEGTRAHAKKVEAVLAGLGMALEAASYLAHADDGYGLLVRPYAVSALDPIHDRIVDSLGKLSDEAGTMPQKLRYVADTFEGQDRDRKHATDQQTAQIASEGGVMR
ncbi:hypothetical protein [Nocardia sp. NPDC050793]|uniref:hypothetical protein n=1 Tax=Nocardia sp. NPDC050793 TaxID=3155159 RepID=UPI0034086191